MFLPLSLSIFIHLSFFIVSSSNLFLPALFPHPPLHSIHSTRMEPRQPLDSIYHRKFLSEYGLLPIRNSHPECWIASIVGARVHDFPGEENLTMSRCPIDTKPKSCIKKKANNMSRNFLFNCAGLSIIHGE